MSAGGGSCRFAVESAASAAGVAVLAVSTIPESFVATVLSLKFQVKWGEGKSDLNSGNAFCVLRRCRSK